MGETGTRGGESRIIAIDGRACAGKTTLARMMGEAWGAAVIRADDFFLRPEQRTQDRYAEPGGNFDRERFERDILQPIRRGQEIRYFPFDCQTMRLCAEPKIYPPASRFIVEGSYVTHPALTHYYHRMIFMDLDPQLQRERLFRREDPASAERFLRLWIPLENKAFTFFGAHNTYDIHIYSRKGRRKNDE